MKDIFPDLKGNSTLKEIIGGKIENGHTNHAYIFSGPLGSGRHTAVMSVIKAFLCTNRFHDSLPCGKCKSCIKVSKGLCPDVEIINRGEKASIGIQKIRELKKNLYILPNDGDFKFYIIENAELMTEEAQNALLLSLEEPPGFVVFFLICEDSSMLLETIKSRALLFKMQLFSNIEINNLLAEYINIEKSKDDLFKICSMSNGTLGQALQLLQATFNITRNDEAVLEAVLNIFTNNKIGILKETESFFYDKESASLFFERMELCVRDIIAVKQAGKLVSLLFFSSIENIPREMSSVSTKKLIELYQNIENARFDISCNVNIKATTLSIFTQNL